MKGGFVTRSGSKRGVAPPRASVNQEAMVRMAQRKGSDLVSSMNPEAVHPAMAPLCQEGAEAYVLLDRPSPTVDATGRIQDGAAGRYLLDVARSVGLSVAVDHVCRTMPPENREPKKYEIEAFREDVLRSIDESGCNVVVLAGNAAVRWGLGSATPREGYETAQRRFWPMKVGDRTVMVTAIADPVHVWGMIESQDPSWNRPGWRTEEATAAFRKNLELAKAMSQALADPERSARVADVEKLKARVEVLTDYGAILEALEDIESAGKPVAYDIETTALRPYGEHARISTMSIANEDRCIAFPYRHADSGFSRAQVESIKGAMRSLFEAVPTCVAHNSPFESEWMAVEYGIDFLFDTHQSCTMQQAYILDERQGALSLNFLSLLYFGVELKSLTDVNTKFVELNNMHELLLYNGLDTLLTLMIWKRQNARLKKVPSLAFAAESQRARIRPLVVAQVKGMPVAQEVVRKQRYELEGSIQIVEGELAALPEVKKFAAATGEFNPTSVPQLLDFFEGLGHHEVEIQERDGVRRSVDEEVLAAIRASKGPGARVAEMLSEYRGLTRNAGTYIRPLDSTERDTLVFRDGHIHPQFKMSRTATGRLSAADPNVQNYPKRSAEGKRVRQCYRAPEGHVFLSIDYSQLEACVIAMLSEDPVWMGMVSSGYDAHTEWSGIVANQAPYALEKETGAKSWDEATPKQRKEYRGLIKNKLVFPAFFGASMNSIAGYLGVDQGDAKVIFDQFWSTFEGVKQWQDRLIAQYHDRRFTECATGRRRYGPFPNKSMVLNSPVQGTASDIVVEAMRRISDHAHATNQPWLHPVLNIHDDVTFIVPESELENCVPYLMQEMVKPLGPFCRVPLSVEAEVGPDWASQTEYASLRGEAWPS